MVAGGICWWDQTHMKKIICAKLSYHSVQKKEEKDVPGKEVEISTFTVVVDLRRCFLGDFQSILNPWMVVNRTRPSKYYQFKIQTQKVVHYEKCAEFDVFIVEPFFFRTLVERQYFPSNASTR